MEEERALRLKLAVPNPASFAHEDLIHINYPTEMIDILLKQNIQKFA